VHPEQTAERLQLFPTTSPAIARARRNRAPGCLHSLNLYILDTNLPNLLAIAYYLYCGLWSLSRVRGTAFRESSYPSLYIGDNPYFRSLDLSEILLNNPNLLYM
jgi:hypothetical protein